MKLHTLALLAAIGSLSAQDLTITNARIIGPNAGVIERGSIVVRAGKIVSAASGAPSAVVGRTIDAKGMTAMPGFIDGHRHINTGPNEKAQMQALLEAGYTTVLSGGGPAEGNITLRDHIDKGLINGPRIIPSGTLRLNNNTPETARAEIRKMAGMGIKFTGEIALTPIPGRGEEGRRDGPGACCQFQRDGGGGRSRRAAAGSLAQQGLGQQGRRKESGYR